MIERTIGFSAFSNKDDVGVDGDYELQCDYCANFISGFEDLDDAVDYKKPKGWRSVKEDGEWFDKCPECIRKDALKEFE